MTFWDPYEGNDFLLVVKPKGEWPDYSESNWIGKGSAISTDESVMQYIEKSLEEMTIQKCVVEKDGVKSGKELKDLMEAGLNAGTETDAGSEAGAEELTPKKEVKTEAKKEAPATKAAKPDFGEEAPKKTEAKVEAKKPTTPAKKEEPKAEAGGDEFAVDFNEADFN
jgi:hypothetical protein